MSHWGSERGEWEKWGTGSVVWKECRPTSETKEAAAALNVPVVCPSPKPQANHISPPPPLAFALQTAKRDIGEGNQLRYCNCWKREVEDLEESSLGPGVSPLLSPSLLRVECGAVWGWRYNPEQRSLGARNERAETSFAITFETGPNASLRPTIVHRLLVFLDEAFRPKREKEEGQKKKKKKTHTETHKSAATMFPQNRPPVSRLRYYVTVYTRLTSLLSYIRSLCYI